MELTDRLQLEDIEKQTREVEDSIQTLKRQLFAHTISRRQFYPQFEAQSLKLMHLQRLMKVHQYRDMNL